MSNNSITNKNPISNDVNSHIPGTPSIEELRMRVLLKNQHKKKRVKRCRKD